ncbi:MAG: ExsB family transcriptional regulator [Candidatus Brocadiia bacterium]
MDPKRFIAEQVEAIQRTVQEGTALSALSGGVDSSVATALAHRALGERLAVVFIDDGLMREDEPREVEEGFAELGIEVQVVDARQRFFEALAGQTDPEDKRKAFRHIFYRVLGEQVKATGASHLVQGTIAADVVETRRGVKTQHNVLEQIGIDSHAGYGFRVIEPLKTLYKPDVRRVGKALGLPAILYQRMPFPGPGLATRCLGEVTPERVEVVRRACKIVEEETRRQAPFQAFAVLMADRATGLDEEGRRTFADMVAVRCVESENAMTASPSRLSWQKLARIRNRILEECPTVSKVLYDLTPKPPSTIEYI